MIDDNSKEQIETFVLPLLRAYGNDEDAVVRLIQAKYTDEQKRRYALYLLPSTQASETWTPTSIEGPRWVRFDKEDDPSTAFTDITLLGRNGAGTEYYSARTKHGAIAAFVKNLRMTPEMQHQRKIAGILNEYRNYNVLRDPNIVAVYDAAWIRTSDGQEFPYIATELLNGVTLEEWRLKHVGNPTTVQCAEICRIIAATLQRLLEVPKDKVRAVLGESALADVMHLDLKPSNVMLLFNESHTLDLRNESQVKLIDFGSGGTAESATAIGTAQTNESYKSPERFLPRQSRPSANQSWDIFSLGGLLYFLWHGNHLRSPERLNSAEWGAYLATISFTDSPDLTLICQKCLMYDPKERYSAPGQLRDDLLAWLSDRPLPYVRRNDYSWFDLKRLLCKRSWQTGNIEDQWEVGAQACLIVSGIFGIAAAAQATFTLLGGEPFRIFNSIWDTSMGLGAAVAIAALSICKWRFASIQIYVPFVTILIGTTILSYCLIPDTPTFKFTSEAHLISGIKYDWCVIGISSAIVSYNNQNGRWFTCMSWLLLLASLTVAPIASVPALRGVLPVMHMLANAILVLCFAFDVFEKINRHKQKIVSEGRIAKSM